LAQVASKLLTEQHLNVRLIIHHEYKKVHESQS
jgi:hypothetical protein